MHSAGSTSNTAGMAKWQHTTGETGHLQKADEELHSRNGQRAAAERRNRKLTKAEEARW